MKLTQFILRYLTKLKVSFEFLPTSSSYYSQMQRTYLVQVYYVTKGQNTLITVTNSTTVSQSSTTSGTSQINPSPELSTQLHAVQQSIAH
ncbi:hypothetical protein [Microbacter margulisiae]|uniref:Asparagine N-glycosylation enzyme membrane subunit Stt3 n=1 Tax=Microbacter margulisiae TaxID=1350067 RepID=A0A7W5DNH7_9PORP|nr:hypothetical protein [Microbacter margulisiae]MBB3186016.1 asparagine N-glycosylation enzyme membrane subunit Stt3 [Microbacter margulisiae]